MLPLMLYGCITWQCVSLRAAEFHHVDPNLMRAVIMAESNGCLHIYNKHSGAIGCTQIGKVHLQGYRDYQLMSDFKYSIPVGAFLLSKCKNVCEYNLGKAGVKKYPEACARYKAKLKKYGWRVR